MSITIHPIIQSPVKNTKLPRTQKLTMGTLELYSPSHDPEVHKCSTEKNILKKLEVFIHINLENYKKIRK